MATYVAGLTEARRVVLITGRDIAKRNEAERQDWKARGISGIVSAVDGDQILLELRTPGRRAHGDRDGGRRRPRSAAMRRIPCASSTRYRAATAEISKGDQLQARGPKSEGDTKMTAEDIVFGTFLTKLGTITAMNRETGEIRIQEVTTKQPLTIHFTAASQTQDDAGHARHDVRRQACGALATRLRPQSQPEDSTCSGRWNNCRPERSTN